MDKIFIKRLEVYAFHGVYSEEKHLGQKFYVSAELTVNTRQAVETDDLQASVNYGEVCKKISEWMQHASFNLIETTAGRLTEYLLCQYPLIEAIVLDLEKPNAPVPYHLETLGIHVERERHIAYLSIGSNMGNREENLMAACTLLEQFSDIHIIDKSPVYETAPYGYTEQAAFLNACLAVSTFRSPEGLLDALHIVENKLGRVRDVHWGPRTLDLDILLFDAMVCDTKTLHIPHIDMQNRLFVLKPLSDIAGYVRHPYLNKTINELLTELENTKKRD